VLDAPVELVEMAIVDDEIVVERLLELVDVLVVLVGDVLATLVEDVLETVAPWPTESLNVPVLAVLFASPA
jgi:hypothetical protein